MREYGRITGPNGQSFVNLGAVVERRHVTGYVKGNRLTTWHGQTMLDCRCQTFAEWSNSWVDPIYVVGWKLTNGRAIVGLSLGDGMLFRGELIDDCLDDDDVRSAAIAEAQHWANVDHEEYERDQMEPVEV